MSDEAPVVEKPAIQTPERESFDTAKESTDSPSKRHHKHDEDESPHHHHHHHHHHSTEDDESHGSDPESTEKKRTHHKKKSHHHRHRDNVDGEESEESPHKRKHRGSHRESPASVSIKASITSEGTQKKISLVNADEASDGQASEGDKKKRRRKHKKDKNVRVSIAPEFILPPTGSGTSQMTAADEYVKEIPVKEYNSLTSLNSVEFRYFDDLTDEDFVSTIEQLDAERKHMILENQVFENFLNANEPTLIAGLPAALETIEKLQALDPIMPLGLRQPPIDPNVGPIKISTAMFSEKGARINISQKTDLVLREMEEMQISLDKFIENSHYTKSILSAQIEETAIRGAEVREAKENFEQIIVIDAVDPITQRIPAEKFIRYMEEWLKAVRLTVEKLRLRTCSFKVQYSKLKNQLIQKEELGETIHEVDFEQLQIENKNLLRSIDKKNLHLLELKKMNGRANLVLSTHKNFLQKAMDELRSLKLAIEDTQLKTEELYVEGDIAYDELQEAEKKYHKMKNVIDNYRVPEILEYIKTKAYLYDLKKNFKIWTRSYNISKISLNTYTRQMKKLTGVKYADREWFRLPENIDDDGSYILLDDDSHSILGKHYMEFDMFNVFGEKYK